MCTECTGRGATEQGVARLGQEAQDAEDAERAAAGARRHALTLVQPSPPVLSEGRRGVWIRARRWPRGEGELRCRTLVRR